MSNYLPIHKKVDLVERFINGSSYRDINETTGIHLDTISRTVLEAGDRCRALQNFLIDGLENIPTVDVVRYEVKVHHILHTVLVAMFDNLVVAYTIGKSLEEASVRLKGKLESKKTKRFRSACAAFRSFIKKTWQYEAHVWMSRVYRTPFPEIYLHRPDSSPKKLETLDAALSLFSVYHNFCKDEGTANRDNLQTPAMRKELTDYCLGLEDIFEYKTVIPFAKIPDYLFDYDEELPKIPHPDYDFPITPRYDTSTIWLGECFTEYLDDYIYAKNLHKLGDHRKEVLEALKYIPDILWDLVEVRFLFCEQEATIEEK